MSEYPPQGPTTQRLDLTDHDWQSYLERLREADDVQRLEPRYKKIIQCVLRIAHEGCGQTFMLHSRNISQSGMGFLHVESLPTGADCTVVLETNEGRGHVITGQVRWSREVGAGAHAVGVVFDEPLDLRDFIDVTEEESEQAGATAA